MARGLYPSERTRVHEEPALVRRPSIASSVVGACALIPPDAMMTWVIRPTPWDGIIEYLPLSELSYCLHKALSTHFPFVESAVVHLLGSTTSRLSADCCPRAA